MQAEILTKAYLASYNLAIKQVRNPEFAAQIAGMVILTINGTLPKQQPEATQVMGLLTQMIVEAGQEERHKDAAGSYSENGNQIREEKEREKRWE